MNTKSVGACKARPNEYSRQYFEEPGRKSLCLMVDATNSCQLDCRYCYYGKKGGSDMNPETALSACRNVAGIFPGQLDDVNIHYMGGEPLLAWRQILDLNARAQAYFAESGIPFRWSMTSNLVSLTERKAEHMMKEGASIHCSIDGTPDIQNHNRPFRKSGRGSFDYVARAIPLALQINPNDTARVTVCPDDAEKMPEIAHEVLGRGFKTVGLFPASGERWTPDRIEGWQRGISDAFDSVRKTWGKGKKITTMIRQTYRGAPQQKKFGYCGAGKGLWGIGIDGGLYFCHHMTNRPDLAIIDAAHSSPEEIRAAIDRSSFPPASFQAHLQCQECPALDFCNGGCWSDNFLVNGSAQFPMASDCQLRVATVQAIGEQMYIYPPGRNEIRACGNCYTCQRSDQSCVSCDNPCQNQCKQCDSCQRCNSCEANCEKSCQHCNLCQSRCESNCQSRCQTHCEDCDSYQGCPDNDCGRCDRD